MTDLPDKLQWHPAFCGAAEVELYDDINDLELVSEYNLSKKPLQIDLLIIKKLGKDNKPIKIKNEIGHIMKRYNIIEYKSPDDGMTIDDFFKTFAYAFLYKGLGKRADEIPIDEITISLFRETYPKKMFQEFKMFGFDIKEQYPGIYYVKGDFLIPVQVVVTSKLLPEKHSSLRILSKKADKSDVKRFIKEAGLLMKSEVRDSIDAVLQASVSANYELYENIRSEFVMCEAMERLMKDVIDEKYDKGKLEGKREGKREGELNCKIKDIKSIMKKLSYTAEQAMDLLEISVSQRKVLLKKL